MRAAEDQMLTSYGWVDPQNGVVRIPIDRAIDLLAQRGLARRGQRRSKRAAGDVSVPTESGARARRCSSPAARWRARIGSEIRRK